MQLAHPFVQLPFRFDAARLAEEVAALGESVWRDHPQKFPGNTMLPLIAVDGDPANEGYGGAMRPTPQLEQCPYLWTVIATLEATIGRSRLMRLDGRAEVTRHADQGYYWVERTRVHVPIVTQPTVRFECGEADVNMAAGECWIFDTWRQHRVINAAEARRIHLVVDTVGGERFWEHVQAGRPAPARASDPEWAPRLVPFDPSAPRPELALETLNIPKVMSPWEIEAHLVFLLGEAQRNPQVGLVHQQATRFARDWRALWMRFGEREEGRAHYQRCLDGFVASVRGPAQPIMLPNQVSLFTAIMTIIGKVALAEQAGPAPDNLSLLFDRA